MPDITNLTRLRETLAMSRTYSDRVDQIMERVQGKDCVRAGINIEVERASKNLAPNGREYHIKIKASTAGIARDAGVIPMDAWRSGGLANFAVNPVILAFHDHKEPIGISVHTELEHDAMVQYWLFHEHTETSRTMKKLYEDGFMRAASVGFIVRDWKFVDELNDDELSMLVKQFGPTAVRDIVWIAQRAELLETSAVPVPSDPNALQFSAAKRSAEAIGIDVSSLVRTTPKTPTEVERMPNTQTTEDQTAEMKRLSDSVESLTTLVNQTAEQNKTLSATVDQLRGEIDALKSAKTEVRETTEQDSIQVEVEVRDGETEEQALDRHLDELVRAKTGAPVPTK